MSESRSLKTRTIRSATWVTLRLAVLVPMQVGYIMMLNRILEPSDFGELAICTVTLLLCEVLSQTGIDVVLMRTRDRVEPLLDAAWSLQLARGGLLALLIVGLSQPIAVYQGSERLFPMMLMIAVVPLIDGGRSMGVVVLGRNLAQGKITALEIASAVISLTAGVLLALWLRSPWAIVWQMLLFSLLRSAYGYVIHPYRPRFTIRWGPLRPFLRYGVFFNLATCTHHLAVSIDKFIIGRMLGLHLLGLYERCFMVCHYGVLQHTKILGATAVPSLSSIAGEKARLRRNLRRYVLMNVGIFVFGATIGLLATESIVHIVLGENFLETIPIFKVLVVFALFRGIATSLHVLFDVFGNSQSRFVINLAQALVLAVALPIGIGWEAAWNPNGLMGASLAVTLAALVNLLLSIVIVGRFVAAQLREEPPVVEERPTNVLVHS